MLAGLVSCKVCPSHMIQMVELLMSSVHSSARLLHMQASNMIVKQLDLTDLFSYAGLTTGTLPFCPKALSQIGSHPI